jgi:ABC-type transport system substrate-binding protein
MQTTYRLHSNLTWHDGAPLTAEDFVFGWQVYSTPELGVSRTEPIGHMAEVLAPDARTVVIRWRRLYPEAAGLDMGFQALPAHILREPFQSALGGDAESFVNLPFWTRDYVSGGPYRLVEWVPGSAIEAAAFAGHALGKPRIEHVRLLITPDPNTALALMLSGEAHFAHDWVFFYEEAATLEQEARARGMDIVLSYALASFRVTGFQLRPEVVQPRAAGSSGAPRHRLGNRQPGGRGRHHRWSRARGVYGDLAEVAAVRGG